jgi:hypothetical protein
MYQPTDFIHPILTKCGVDTVADITELDKAVPFDLSKLPIRGVVTDDIAQLIYNGYEADAVLCNSISSPEKWLLAARLNPKVICMRIRLCKSDFPIVNYDEEFIPFFSKQWFMQYQDTFFQRYATHIGTQFAIIHST